MILSKNFVNNIFNFDKYDLVFLPAPRVQKELFKIVLIMEFYLME